MAGGCGGVWAEAAIGASPTARNASAVEIRATRSTIRRAKYVVSLIQETEVERSERSAEVAGYTKNSRLRRKVSREGYTLGDSLCDHGQLQLRCFSFDGNFFLGFFETLDVTTYGVLRHSASVLQIFSFRHKSRE